MSQPSPGLPPMKRMLRLTVRVRARDDYRGKPISEELLSLYRGRGISGATVLQGVRGYGARGAARVDVLGLSVNLPVVVETVDEYQRVEQVLPDVKRIVGTNGLITLEEVNVF